MTQSSAPTSRKRGGTAAISRRGFLLATTGSAALAAACVPGQASDAPKAPSTQAFKLLWQINSGAPSAELAKWGIERFKQQYPNATVENALSAGNVEATVALMVAGEGPDILHAWGDRFWEYAGKGQLYNHNDLLRDDKKADIDDFVDYHWKGFVIPGTNFRYGMPAYINTMVLYYNKSLFAQRGQKEPTVDWTHDDYAAMLKQMTFQDGEKKVWGGWLPAISFDRFQAHIVAFGGNVVDPKDFTKSALAEPKAQQGLEWLRARYWSDRTAAPLDNAQQTWQPNGARPGFYQGALATMIEGAQGINVIAENMTSAEWSIAHIPKGPTRRATLGTTDGWGLWKGTKSKDAAWDLMKLLTGKEFFEQQIRLVGLIPSRKSMLDPFVKILREKWPTLVKVDLKVITDLLTTLNYATLDEVFLCQSQAIAVLRPAMWEVFRDGKAPVSLFRDIKPQLDTAAASCGVKPDQVFK
ncbi:MAG: ABC transporter substrate-binding protein [Chloroflexota bacterium]